MIVKKRDDARFKSNYLRRRRVAQAATDVSRGARDQDHDTERRGIPNGVPAPRRRRV